MNQSKLALKRIKKIYTAWRKYRKAVMEFEEVFDNVQIIGIEGTPKLHVFQGMDEIGRAVKPVFTDIYAGPGNDYPWNVFFSMEDVKFFSLMKDEEYQEFKQKAGEPR